MREEFIRKTMHSRVGDVDGTSNSVVAALSAMSIRYSAMFGCGSAFLSGVLVILLIEALILMFVVMRSLERKARPSIPHTSSVSVEIPDNSLTLTLQGGVWITPLPAGDIKKMYTRREKALKEKAAKDEKSDNEKGSKDSKSKRDPLRDYIQITPVWRQAKLQGRILHLSTPQGAKESILLEGCSILAVSASNNSTRKWAKKYPIRVHHGGRLIYGGYHDCLLYLDTGWEKESWCEVLRGAANLQSTTGDPYYKVKKEFKEYLQRVELQFPFFSRVHSGRIAYVAEERVKASKVDQNSSIAKKRGLLWKKLTRRSLRSIRDGKSSDSREDLKRADDMSIAEEGSSRGSTSSTTGSMGDAALLGSASLEDLVSEASLSKEESVRTSASLPARESPSNSMERDAQGYTGDSMEQALLCGNALFARLFFDLSRSEAVVSRIRSIVQRQLSKVPTPSYIGSIKCAKLELGNSPPLARNLSFLPVDGDGNWGLEADLEYHGGAILTIGTCIDVRDPSSREKVVAQGLEQSPVGGAAADLLAKGLESYAEDMNIAVDEGTIGPDQRTVGGTPSSSRPADVRDSEEASRKGWMHSSITNVKAIMSRVAEHVSQVPLALTIKVVQLKGTLQVRIKPPPSDRVWFSFTKMPTLELVPEPCIGEHKINSGPLGAFIVNQIKILLREAMVFPQFADLSYSWMLSDKHNWVPRDDVPLQFVAEQASSEQSTDKERREERRSQFRREGSVDNVRLEASDAGVGATKSFPGTTSYYGQENQLSPLSPPRKSLASTMSLPVKPIETARYLDLTRPLLEKEDSIVEGSANESEIVSVHPETNQPVSSEQTQLSLFHDSESGSIRHEDVDPLERQSSSRLPGSKRAKVLGFGKKMGTKLDEKRRNVVDKMQNWSQLGPDHIQE